MVLLVPQVGARVPRWEQVEHPSGKWEFPEGVNAEYPREYAEHLALRLRVRRVSRALRNPNLYRMYTPSEY